MARREKKKGGDGGDPLWLITFSDLVTLLLTFFVLILSMSSMDVSILTRVNLFVNDIGFVTKRSAGRVPHNVELILTLLENPADVLLKPNRIKDLLFPDEILPQELDRSTLEENLEILQHPEGLALVLSDKLIFPENSARLDPLAKALLGPIAELLRSMSADVNIAGYSGEYESEERPFALSAARALAVLDFFVHNALDDRRFSISAYGHNLPFREGGMVMEPSNNRRVSILVKTTPLFTGYQNR